MLSKMLKRYWNFSYTRDNELIFVFSAQNILLKTRDSQKI